MSMILSIDPGQNTGIALGSYSAITPYTLDYRWQVHGGVEGFINWWESNTERVGWADTIVCESFELRRTNTFQADIEPKAIEGALRVFTHYSDYEIAWQTAAQKASLIGYPESADTADKRQRLRYEFLDRFGLFKAGTENDDSNDAITHALVYLRSVKHAPTLHTFWPDTLRGHLTAVPAGPTF